MTIYSFARGRQVREEGGRWSARVGAEDWTPAATGQSAAASLGLADSDRADCVNRVFPGSVSVSIWSDRVEVFREGDIDPPHDGGEPIPLFSGKHEQVLSWLREHMVTSDLEEIRSFLVVSAGRRLPWASSAESQS